MRYIFAHILHITGSVQIVFIHTIKYVNIYLNLKVNNWDISPENGKGFAVRGAFPNLFRVRFGVMVSDSDPDVAPSAHCKNYE